MMAGGPMAGGPMAGGPVAEGSGERTPRVMVRFTPEASEDIERALEQARRAGGIEGMRDLSGALVLALGSVHADPRGGGRYLGYVLRLPALRTWTLPDHGYLLAVRLSLASPNAWPVPWGERDLRADILRVLSTRRDIPNALWAPSERLLSG
jgi:plasmid stabilization system protein ParE